MSSEFRLPDLGENVAGGEVVRALVAEGDTIEKNQTVIELETDKALLEVPSPASGRVVKVHVAAGKKIKVNDLIITYEAAPDGAEPKSAAEQPKQTPKPGAPQPAAPPPKPTVTSATLGAVADQEESETKAAAARSTSSTTSTSSAPSEARVVEVGGAPHVVAAPSTRRLARELGVDINEIKGTAGGGRITEEDVREHVRQRLSGSKPAPAARPTGAAGGPVQVTGRLTAPPLPDFTQYGMVERKPLSNVRKRTMEQLSLSWSLIPHVTQVDEADVTDLEALRQRHAKHAEAKGGKLTSTVFVLKAVIAALKQYPQFNASLDPESEELIVKKFYNIGIAVDTEHGLIVPVIRDVDKKHLIDLSAELSLVSERTRQRKITLDDLRGGTFTISNLGGIGGTAFSPIINYPEVAILGLARYQKRLVMKNDRLETRLFLPLCLSYDHRIIDGADGVRFTRKIAEMLEDPALLLLE